MSAVIYLLFILISCHPQVSYMRPSDGTEKNSSNDGGRLKRDLDTSIFSLDYDYDSDPYLPTSMGLKEAKMIDPWTLDFRRKLQAREIIGKHYFFYFDNC